MGVWGEVREGCISLKWKCVQKYTTLCTCHGGGGGGGGDFIKMKVCAKVYNSLYMPFLVKGPKYTMDWSSEALVQ